MCQSVAVGVLRLGSHGSFEMLCVIHSKSHVRSDASVPVSSRKDMSVRSLSGHNQIISFYLQPGGERVVFDIEDRFPKSIEEMHENARNQLPGLENAYLGTFQSR
jgi:hypothetical protein